MKITPLVLAALAAVAAGCGKSGSTASAPASSGSSTASATSSYPGMEADLAQTLKTESDFYLFKNDADLARDTAGLKWDDGSDLPSFASPKAKRGGIMTEWIPDYPGTLRMNGPNANDSFRSYLQDYQACTYIDAHPNYPGRYFPIIADRWALDAKTATVFYHIDPDARWSDGVPITTDDVVFQWYFMRSKNLNDPWYQDWYHEKFSRLTVYDSLTFSVTLKVLRPDAIYLIGYSNPIPKHFFKEFGPGWEHPYNWRFEPTPGAYIIRDQDLRSQVSVTLTHLPHWWAEDKKFMKGRYNPDKLRVVAVHDPDKAFEEFTRGDLDIFSLNDSQVWYNKLPDTSPTVESGFTVKATVYHQIPVPDYALWLNEAKPTLDNPDIRVGIQYATNVDLVCRQYFHGDAVRQQTRSDGYSWNINPAVHPRPFDPEKARAAFARAGYTHQGPDGILTNDQGQRLAFTITSMYKRYNDVLAILKEEAVKAGLEFNIESPDPTTGWEKLMEKRHEIAFMAFQRTNELYPRYWDDDHSMNAYDHPFLADGHTPNPARKVRQQTDNITSIANPVIDALIERYDQTKTMDELKPIAAELEQRLWDDAGWVGLWKLPFYRVGYRPWIKWPDDFTPMQSLDYLQYWTMWIDQDEQKADLAAKADGRALPKQVLVYDKYKEQ